MPIFKLCAPLVFIWWSTRGEGRKMHYKAVHRMRQPRFQFGVRMMPGGSLSRTIGQRNRRSPRKFASESLEAAIGNRWAVGDQCLHQSIQ